MYLEPSQLVVLITSLFNSDGPGEDPIANAEKIVQEAPNEL